MNFGKLFFVLLACVLAVAMVAGAPSPRWKPFKKIERIGQHVRDGIIKAGPAVAVVGSAASLAG